MMYTQKIAMVYFVLLGISRETPSKYTMYTIF